ncbi:MAG: hypothetical protein R3C13_02360 [Hyphomonas sp.]|uniref:hypothetical protein n=1 Tax=Hyphomonas sp. TaxID=87 RepID=UPI0035271A29
MAGIQGAGSRVGAEQCILSLSTNDGAKELIQQIAVTYLGPTSDQHIRKEFMHALVSILYKTGTVGVKTPHSDKVVYAYQHPYDLDLKTLTDDTYLSVSPMLWPALQIIRKRKGEIAGTSAK